MDRDRKGEGKFVKDKTIGNSRATRFLLGTETTYHLQTICGIFWVGTGIAPSNSGDGSGGRGP